MTGLLAVVVILLMVMTAVVPAVNATVRSDDRSTGTSAGDAEVDEVADSLSDVLENIDYNEVMRSILAGSDLEQYLDDIDFNQIVADLDLPEDATLQDVIDAIDFTSILESLTSGSGDLMSVIRNLTVGQILGDIDLGAVIDKLGLSGVIDADQIRAALGNLTVGEIMDNLSSLSVTDVLGFIDLSEILPGTVTTDDDIATWNIPDVDNDYVTIRGCAVTVSDPDGTISVSIVASQVVLKTVGLSMINCGASVYFDTDGNYDVRMGLSNLTVGDVFVGLFTFDFSHTGDGDHASMIVISEDLSFRAAYENSTPGYATYFTVGYGDFTFDFAYNSADDGTVVIGVDGLIVPVTVFGDSADLVVDGLVLTVPADDTKATVSSEKVAVEVGGETVLDFTSMFNGPLYKDQPVEFTYTVGDVDLKVSDDVTLTMKGVKLTVGWYRADVTIGVTSDAIFVNGVRVVDGFSLQFGVKDGVFVTLSAEDVSIGGVSVTGFHLSVCCTADRHGFDFGFDTLEIDINGDVTFTSRTGYDNWSSGDEFNPGSIDTYVSVYDGVMSLSVAPTILRVTVPEDGTFSAVLPAVQTRYCATGSDTCYLAVFVPTAFDFDNLVVEKVYGVFTTLSTSDDGFDLISVSRDCRLVATLKDSMFSSSFIADGLTAKGADYSLRVDAEFVLNIDLNDGVEERFSGSAACDAEFKYLDSEGEKVDFTLVINDELFDLNASAVYHPTGSSIASYGLTVKCNSTGATVTCDVYGSKVVIDGFIMTITPVSDGTSVSVSADLLDLRSIGFSVADVSVSVNVFDNGCFDCGFGFRTICVGSVSVDSVSFKFTSGESGDYVKISLVNGTSSFDVECIRSETRDASKLIFLSGDVVFKVTYDSAVDGGTTTVYIDGLRIPTEIFGEGSHFDVDNLSINVPGDVKKGVMSADDVALYKIVSGADKKVLDLTEFFNGPFYREQAFSKTFKFSVADLYLTDDITVTLNNAAVTVTWVGTDVTMAVTSENVTTGGQRIADTVALHTGIRDGFYVTLTANKISCGDVTVTGARAHFSVGSEGLVTYASINTLDVTSSSGEDSLTVHVGYLNEDSEDVYDPYLIDSSVNFRCTDDGVNVLLQVAPVVIVEHTGGEKPVRTTSVVPGFSMNVNDSSSDDDLDVSIYVPTSFNDSTCVIEKVYTFFLGMDLTDSGFTFDCDSRNIDASLELDDKVVDAEFSVDKLFLSGSDYAVDTDCSFRSTVDLNSGAEDAFTCTGGLAVKSTFVNSDGDTVRATVTGSVDDALVTVSCTSVVTPVSGGASTYGVTFTTNGSNVTFDANASEVPIDLESGLLVLKDVSMNTGASGDRASLFVTVGSISYVPANRGDVDLFVDVRGLETGVCYDAASSEGVTATFSVDYLVITVTEVADDSMNVLSISKVENDHTQITSQHYDRDGSTGDFTDLVSEVAVDCYKDSVRITLYVPETDLDYAVVKGFEVSLTFREDVVTISVAVQDIVLNDIVKASGLQNDVKFGELTGVSFALDVRDGGVSGSFGLTSLSISRSDAVKWSLVMGQDDGGVVVPAISLTFGDSYDLKVCVDSFECHASEDNTSFDFSFDDAVISSCPAVDGVAAGSVICQYNGNTTSDDGSFCRVVAKVYDLGMTVTDSGISVSMRVQGTVDRYCDGFCVCEVIYRGPSSFGCADDVWNADVQLGVRVHLFVNNVLYDLSGTVRFTLDTSKDAWFGLSVSEGRLVCCDASIVDGNIVKGDLRYIVTLDYDSATGAYDLVLYAPGVANTYVSVEELNIEITGGSVIVEFDYVNFTFITATEISTGKDVRFVLGLVGSEDDPEMVVEDGVMTFNVPVVDVYADYDSNVSDDLGKILDEFNASKDEIAHNISLVADLAASGDFSVDLKVGDFDSKNSCFGIDYDKISFYCTDWSAYLPVITPGSGSVESSVVFEDLDLKMTVDLDGEKPVTVSASLGDFSSDAVVTLAALDGVYIGYKLTSVTSDKVTITSESFDYEMDEGEMVPTTKLTSNWRMTAVVDGDHSSVRIGAQDTSVPVVFYAPYEDGILSIPLKNTSFTSEDDGCVVLVDDGVVNLTYPMVSVYNLVSMASEDVTFVGNGNAELTAITDGGVEHVYSFVTDLRIAPVSGGVAGVSLYDLNSCSYKVEKISDGTVVSSQIRYQIAVMVIGVRSSSASFEIAALEVYAPDMETFKSRPDFKVSASLSFEMFDENDVSGSRFSTVLDCSDSDNTNRFSTRCVVTDYDESENAPAFAVVFNLSASADPVQCSINVNTEQSRYYAMFSQSRTDVIDGVDYVYTTVYTYVNSYVTSDGTRQLKTGTTVRSPALGRLTDDGYGDVDFYYDLAANGFRCTYKGYDASASEGRIVTTTNHEAKINTSYANGSFGSELTVSDAVYGSLDAYVLANTVTDAESGEPHLSFSGQVSYTCAENGERYYIGAYYDEMQLTFDAGVADVDVTDERGRLVSSDAGFEITYYIADGEIFFGVGVDDLTYTPLNKEDKDSVVIKNFTCGVTYHLNDQSVTTEMDYDTFQFRYTEKTGYGDVVVEISLADGICLKMSAEQISFNTGAYTLVVRGAVFDCDLTGEHLVVDASVRNTALCTSDGAYLSPVLTVSGIRFNQDVDFATESLPASAAVGLSISSFYSYAAENGVILHLVSIRDVSFTCSDGAPEFSVGSGFIELLVSEDVTETDADCYYIAVTLNDDSKMYDAFSVPLALSFSYTCYVYDSDFEMYLIEDDDTLELALDLDGCRCQISLGVVRDGFSFDVYVECGSDGDSREVAVGIEDLAVSTSECSLDLDGVRCSVIWNDGTVTSKLVINSCTYSSEVFPDDVVRIENLDVSYVIDRTTREGNLTVSFDTFEFVYTQQTDYGNITTEISLNKDVQSVRITVSSERMAIDGLTCEGVKIVIDTVSGVSASADKISYMCQHGTLVIEGLGIWYSVGDASSELEFDVKKVSAHFRSGVYNFDLEFAHEDKIVTLSLDWHMSFNGIVSVNVDNLEYDQRATSVSLVTGGAEVEIDLGSFSAKVAVGKLDARFALGAGSVFSFKCDNIGGFLATDDVYCSASYRGIVGSPVLGEDIGFAFTGDATCYASVGSSNMELTGAVEVKALVPYEDIIGIVAGDVSVLDVLTVSVTSAKLTVASSGAVTGTVSDVKATYDAGTGAFGLLFSLDMPGKLVMDDVLITVLSIDGVRTFSASSTSASVYATVSNADACGAVVTLTTPSFSISKNGVRIGFRYLDVDANSGSTSAELHIGYDNSGEAGKYNPAYISTYLQVLCIDDVLYVNVSAAPAVMVVSDASGQKTECRVVTPGVVILSGSHMINVYLPVSVDHDDLAVDDVYGVLSEVSVTDDGFSLKAECQNASLDVDSTSEVFSGKMNVSGVHIDADEFTLDADGVEFDTDVNATIGSYELHVKDLQYRSKVLSDDVISISNLDMVYTVYMDTGETSLYVNYDVFEFTVTVDTDFGSSRLLILMDMNPSAVTVRQTFDRFTCGEFSAEKLVLLSIVKSNEWTYQVTAGNIVCGSFVSESAVVYVTESDMGFNLTHCGFHGAQTPVIAEFFCDAEMTSFDLLNTSVSGCTVSGGIDVVYGTGRSVVLNVYSVTSASGTEVARDCTLTVDFVNESVVLDAPMVAYIDEYGSISATDLRVGCSFASGQPEIIFSVGTLSVHRHYEDQYIDCECAFTDDSATVDLSCNIVESGVTLKVTKLSFVATSDSMILTVADVSNKDAEGYLHIVDATVAYTPSGGFTFAAGTVSVHGASGDRHIDLEYADTGEKVTMTLDCDLVIGDVTVLVDGLVYLEDDDGVTLTTAGTSYLKVAVGTFDAEIAVGAVDLRYVTLQSFDMTCKGLSASVSCAGFKWSVAINDMVGKLKVSFKTGVSFTVDGTFVENIDSSAGSVTATGSVGAVVSLSIQDMISYMKGEVGLADIAVVNVTSENITISGMATGECTGVSIVYNPALGKAVTLGYDLSAQIGDCTVKGHCSAAYDCVTGVFTEGVQDCQIRAESGSIAFGADVSSAAVSYDVQSLLNGTVTWSVDLTSLSLSNNDDDRYFLDVSSAPGVTTAFNMSGAVEYNLAEPVVTCACGVNSTGYTVSVGFVVIVGHFAGQSIVLAETGAVGSSKVIFNTEGATSEYDVTASKLLFSSRDVVFTMSDVVAKDGLTAEGAELVHSGDVKTVLDFTGVKVVGTSSGVLMNVASYAGTRDGKDMTLVDLNAEGLSYYTGSFVVNSEGLFASVSGEEGALPENYLFEFVTVNQSKVTYGNGSYDMPYGTTLDMDGIYKMEVPNGYVIVNNEPYVVAVASVAVEKVPTISEAVDGDGKVVVDGTVELTKESVEALGFDEVTLVSSADGSTIRISKAALQAIVGDGTGMYVDFGWSNVIGSEYQEAILEGQSESDAKKLLAAQYLYVDMPGASQKDNLGSVVVTIPFDLNGRDANDLHVYYFNGKFMEKLDCRYFEENGQGYIQFTTSHFSLYVISEELGEKSKYSSSALAWAAVIVAVLVILGLAVWYARTEGVFGHKE